MPVRPTRKQLQPVNTSLPPVPVDQIIQVRGRNPLAEGITNTSGVLMKALAEREALRRQAQQTEVISQTFKNMGFEAPPPGVTPEQAMQLGTIQAGMVKSRNTPGIIKTGGALYNTENGEWITPPQPSVGPSKPGASFKQESSLRKDFLNQSKDFRDVADAYKRVIDSSMEPSAAGDVALIFNFMKILDPGSVVREGEFATAQNAASIPERVRAEYNKAISGERLTPSTRNDFIQQAGNLYFGQAERQGQRESEFSRIAELAGANPKSVVVDMKLKNVKKTKPVPQTFGVVKIASDADYSALKSGEKFIGPDGKLRRKP